MTATLADDSVLVSHFDCAEAAVEKVITPSFANDIGDRMILIPQELNPDLTDEELKSSVATLSRELNVVVIVPSAYRAGFWADVAKLVLTADNLYDGVQRLKDGHLGLVVLVNKYDGIDLPDDACRVLVIDGLPDVRRRIDKVEQSVLSGSTEVVNQWLQRIEQGMGRGVRSSEDHCVVFLMGHSLTSSLCSHDAMQRFSPATKAQLVLAEKLGDQLRGRGIDAIAEATQFCLKRNAAWVRASKGALVKVAYPTKGMVNPSTVLRQQSFGAALTRNYSRAVELLQKAIDNSTERRVRGWLKQQLAEYRNFTDPVDSQRILKSGVDDNSAVLCPLEGIQYTPLRTVTIDQATECVRAVNAFRDPNALIVCLNGLLENLAFRPNSASPFEQAMKEVALLIGFGAQRPEAEFRKGPDVLWETGNNCYCVIECKNEAVRDTISKGDCDQLSGSMNWFLSKYGRTCTGVPIMVHPAPVADAAASPAPETRVITREKLAALHDALRGFVKAVAGLPDRRNVTAVRGLLTHFRLTGTAVVEQFTVRMRVTA